MNAKDDKLASDLALAVVRLARHLRGRRQSSTVSLTQLSALSTLDREGPMTPGAMAAQERVQPPSMTRVIASLADLGMVKRDPHPTDGRQIIVTLSDLGNEVVRDETNAREAWLRGQLEKLDGSEQAVLRQAVEIMSTMVSSSD
ncbi:MarR family winged helix-turn-helix transcriptional regulator [Williamsia sp. MIQD14]|uniref:MarR family transcriptional regulator n=1 Tax=Williamsia herbipolensis TaxID=1603258 RepID=A0AAU4K0V3_9NOCA|nr:MULTISPECIES: MarR family transcriptional regulator [Williamsia]KQS00622.1 MarR family transcriptional regulator [Williamsia sp. Leaf354]MCX6467861.1 MarR family transcriptional regulator [Mycobacteriales bacterium]